MSESSELIPENGFVTGGHARAGNAPGLVFPAPSSVQQFNVFALQYSIELHITQMRTEIRELEAHAERRHKQHILTYEEAAAVGLANVEERAEKNHLEAMAELQARLATSEYKAVNRENTLLAEMSLLQQQALEGDRVLREELAEMSSKHISDALDQHLAESRFAETSGSRPINMLRISASNGGAVPSAFLCLRSKTKAKKLRRSLVNSRIRMMNFRSDLIQLKGIGESLGAGASSYP